MSIRTILAPLSGGSSSEGAIETACDLALRFGAHIEALHVRTDPTEALPLLGQDISTPVAAELIELAQRESGHAPSIVPRRARLSDLVVLGQSGRVADKPHSDTLDEAVVLGGRPVLLAPARPLGPLGEVIAIAWNASPEAARAVAGALPFLGAARAVHILSVGKEDDSLSDAELASYLGWHGIAAVAHHIQPVKGVKRLGAR